MASSLNRLKKDAILQALYSTIIDINGHRLFRRRFASAAAFNQEKSKAGYGRREFCGQQVRLLHGSSLSLSRLLHLSHDRSHDSPYFQIPCLLSYSSAPSLLSSVQKMLAPSSAASFCGVPDGDSDSDSDSGAELNQKVKSKADLEEVDNVCKIIDELFTLDRSMEAVLDDCGINLTHDLVIDVLERYRHARKPAFRFFSWAANKPGFSHDSNTYNKMMSILGKNRQFETMMILLEEMGEKKLLTMETFEIAIKAFAEAKERKKAVGIFELMKKHNYKVGADTINCLLDSLGRAKLGQEAQTLFDKLKERFTPNLKTYTVLLNGWCRVKNLLEAGKIWNQMIDNGFQPDIVAHNTMLEGLLKSRKKSEAIKLFELMKSKGPSPNVRSYTILIKDLSKQKRMNESLDYFNEMMNSGCRPDAAIYTCLMTGFGNLKKMDIVYSLLKEMKQKDCNPDSRTYNALIKLMTNRKMPDDAARVYEKMIESGFKPTIHTYNMMMRCYFMCGDFSMGHKVWDEMNRMGICPDDNSYVVFIGGLIKEGRSEIACKYLEEMIEKGMKAPQVDYNKFAADFARIGNGAILEELAQKMMFTGKFDASNHLAKWAERMKTRFVVRSSSNGIERHTPGMTS